MDILKNKETTPKLEDSLAGAVVTGLMCWNCTTVNPDSSCAVGDVTDYVGTLTPAMNVSEDDERVNAR